jgi:hypothetical protein
MPDWLKRWPVAMPVLLGGLAGILLVLFVLVTGPWLFTRSFKQDLTAEQELKARNDVRGTLVQSLGGLVLAGGLVLTYSTYRQNRKEQDRSYELRMLDQQHTYAHRLTEQVNELYAKAVEQLGHESAAVRLGGLYAIERLAQNNPQQRQTVVDVVCAYLRMPFDPPGAELTATAVPESPPTLERIQEREVRLAAQRVLARHLRATDSDLFWPDTRIDLSGAVLLALDLEKCEMLEPRFLQTRFLGLTLFHYAVFHGDTSFAGATFEPSTGIYVGERMWYWAGAGFDGTKFLGEVTFFDCRFGDRVTFNQATFHKKVNFKGAKFRPARDPSLLEVSFHDARVRGEGLSKSDWPPGWKVEPNEQNAAEGHLIPSLGGPGA